MLNEFNPESTVSLFAPIAGDFADQPLLNGSDLRRPWRSGCGFPLAAASLATGQKLILVCREDEIFPLMTRLNDLIEQPKNLRRALQMLTPRVNAVYQQLAHLMQLKRQPLLDFEVPELCEAIERILAETVTRTTRGGRVAELLSPDQPTDAIPGLSRMLERLQEVIAALETVKDSGFRVKVYDRRRQPSRPALEERRHTPMLLHGQSAVVLPAGFLQPPQYHLSLWAYLVGRSDGRPAAVWN